MTDVESRLARVEERAGGLQSQITQLDKRVDQVTPLLTQVATLNERQVSMHATVLALSESFIAFEKKVDDRDQAARDDGKQFNRWIIGLAVLVVLGLIGSTVTLLTLVIQS